MVLAAVSELSKQFAGRTLFSGISFGLEEKERAALVGPNGAGKSTLLQLLSGDLAPDSGEVTRRRGLRLGFLRQTPSFSKDSTILSSLLEIEDDYSKALTWIAQTELDRLPLEQPVSELSGGWQKRVALARELMKEPELLLLDEPTNHLDLTSILWLEKFLTRQKFAVLMITHDRMFLQRTAQRILDLDPRNPHHLLDIKGTYQAYLETKEIELAALERHERVLKNTLRREREWLSRGSLARQTKQRARIDNAHALAEQVDTLSRKNRQNQIELDFSTTENSPQKLIEAKGVNMAYGDKVVFKNLNVLISRRTRLALMGDNGSGKSTLIRILLGQEEPSAGVVHRADKLSVAHFEQTRDSLNPKISVLKNICPEGDYVNFQGQFLHVRSYLDRFNFSGSKVDLTLERLSGGEQARVRLAQLMLMKAQLLVLDEPTNDLDADTLELLIQALEEFPGAVILVSHDRYFVDQVADEILSVPGLIRFADSLQWESFQLEQHQTKPQAPAEKPTEAGPQKKVRLSFKEKFEFDNMEATITALEDEIRDLNAQSQAPEVLADHQRLGQVHAQLAEAQAELEQKYNRWAELEARIQGH